MLTCTFILFRLGKQAMKKVLTQE